ncbi:PREDICTED: uncharacterized protein At3g49720-like isoform X2 [Tarenaya hassleriana]|uniref:uncharacterized protein At3g49720-like isoform X2 n=1 Tax=Tarenaya hassleriana TaxID=28532 RepID=UPI00053C9FF9|nr:PREDICTED: uncharacterized protein At3g49720-like isoform X2 [Tarenaya hassleriana]
MRFLSSLAIGTSLIKLRGMSRRHANPTRRYGDGGGAGGLFSSKSRSSSYLSIGLLVLGSLLLVLYLRGGSGRTIEAFSRVQGDYTCAMEVQRALPVLKKTYGDSMHKVLHVGPDTCSIVSNLMKEEDTEAWGVEPYDMEDADSKCKGLVHRGSVRVADIKFPLPYRAKSFPLVIVSDALDYLSPRYLNKTLPDLARVSAESLVIFTGQQRSKSTDVSRFGRAAKLRSPSWWVRFFTQTSLEENEAMVKKFEQAALQSSYQSKCQIFHLKSYQ